MFIRDLVNTGSIDPLYVIERHGIVDSKKEKEGKIIYFPKPKKEMKEEDDV